MKAAYYEKQGPANEVLKVGEIDEILPQAGEVQIQIVYAGVNPGEIKKRNDSFGGGMPYPRVIPHSDGSGMVKKVGEGVDSNWIGKTVMCFGAQSYRPFGTASELCSVPVEKVVAIGEGVDLKQAAQMGIPGITAYQAVHVGGDIQGKTILVQGAAGAVGQCALMLAKRAGAKVLGVVRKQEDQVELQKLGYQSIFLAGKALEAEIKKQFPEDIDHIVEVAFSDNLELNLKLLKNGGSIATYASREAEPKIPFWPLVFENIRLYFLGSDDFPIAIKQAAMEEVAKALSEGWQGLEIGQIYPLEDIVQAHEHVEQNKKGRALIKVKTL